MMEGLGQSGGIIGLRPQEAGDEQFLFRVFISGRPDLEAICGMDDGVRYEFCHRQFLIEQEQMQCFYPDALLYIVLLGGEPAGRLCVHYGISAVRILAIVLLPEFRGRGIGALLIRDVLEKAGTAGLPVGLSVFWFNAGARRFYERLGFAVTEDTGAYSEMRWTPANKNGGILSV